MVPSPADTKVRSCIPRASAEKIVENDYNLNIPRYGDTFEPEERTDIAGVQREINKLEEELAEVRKRMDGYLKELGINA